NFALISPIIAEVIRIRLYKQQYRAYDEHKRYIKDSYMALAEAPLTLPPEVLPVQDALPLYETTPDEPQRPFALIGNCVEVISVMFMSPRIHDVASTIGDFVISIDTAIRGYKS